MIDNNITTTVDLIQTSKSLINDLNFISQNVLIYLPLIYFIFGFIGFIGNVFTYLQPQLRSNTSCIYLLCGSFIDISSLSINSFSSYLAWQFGFTLPWSTSSALCKLSVFLLVFLTHLAINFLCMAIIDRFAVTCDHTSSIRRITQLRIVPCMIGLTVLTSGLSTLYAPINYDLSPAHICLSTQPMLTTISSIVLIRVIPSVTMITFVLLTYRNVRRSRGRVGDAAQKNRPNLRNQFIVTIFAQILVTVCITIPWIIILLYSTFTSISTKTPVEVSIINFVLGLTSRFFYLNNVKAFYITILTSRLFRKAFIDGLNNLFHRYIRQQMNVSMVNPFT
ncbi:unnamed protein product [Adineta steineri]|uniref:G-protein coupled receptors family 1 profile domain-containing protein n=1 Tax=Adineta steineri TaxID=433720 RepID=A0A814MJD3_9BILA|nr:unnamed protein product [Adineta steineri]